MAATGTRRTTTFKQFLLRVHPDHFRAIPKVHDENLHSIQLLNQFMDEQRAASAFFHHGSSQRKRVFFSAYVPTSSSSAASEKGDTQQLKRFRLDLATNIETHMARILRECGVEVPASPESSSSGSSSRDREAWDYDSERYRATSSSSSTARGGMDFGFNAHFAQYVHTRRRKRSILTLPQFFAYMDEPETRAKQQQVRHAHDSIQSVTRTLTREFGLREVATSCGWASVPLNATLLSLAKTLRKVRHSIQLQGVRLDMRADASEIDFFDEYTVVLNVADVPLQWVELLETVDAAMLESIHAAHASLEKLQRAAERALGAGTSVRRGRTCSALAYRGFLQDMATTATLFGDDPVRADDRRRHDAVVEQVSIVVEDAVRECEILDDGAVRAPSCATAAHVLEFVDAHRDEIRDQVAEHDAQRQQFLSVAAQCVRVLGLESLTFAEGLRLEDVNRATAKLLAFASDGQRYGSAQASEVLQATQGRALRFDRYFGLAQDGVFTLPTEWMAS